MNHGLFEYDIEVRDARSLNATDSAGAITSGCHVIVYDAGTKTKATIYADENRTAKTNDITRTQFGTDTRIKFFAAASTVDLFIADNQGNNVLHSSVAPTVHVLPLDRSSVHKCFFFPMVFNAGGTEVDTGLDLPKNSMVRDVALEVVDIDATETVSIGILASETNGDADGFLLASSVATAGFYASYDITDGATEDFVGASRKGALLGLGSTGTNTANDFGQPGGAGHFVQGANGVSISYQPSSSDTFTGYGYLWVTVLR